MKAILINEFGGSDQLYIGDQPTPIPSNDQLLVKVKAAALNRADILQREGKYPPPDGESNVLGLEIAGVIVDKGENATDWNIGDKVFGIVPGGGYAEFAVIHKDMAMAIPDNLDYIKAAAIPEAFLTAYQAVTWHAETKPKEKALVHAGGSGVGTAAIQLLKHIGATCVVTASKSKHEKCNQLGAEYCIDYASEDFHEVVNNKFKGVDVIIDFLGASYFEKNIKSLNKDGRLVMLALMGGVKLENLNLAPIVLNRLKIIGSTLRSRDLDYQIHLTKEFWSFTYKWFENGELLPVIDKVFDWKDVASAHNYMESNKNTGKIVLTIP